MNKSRKVKYQDEPIGKIKVVRDFLPSPENLVMKEDNIKITLSLTKESVDFFKKEAEVYNTHYQAMIRNLLNQYADHYRNHHK